MWLALGAAAVYFLAPQAGALGESVGVLAEANPLWVGAGVALVAVRYVVSALSLAAAAGEHLPVVPTTMVQLATSFVGRLTGAGGCAEQDTGIRMSLGREASDQEEGPRWRTRRSGTEARTR